MAANSPFGTKLVSLAQEKPKLSLMSLQPVSLHPTFPSPLTHSFPKVKKKLTKLEVKKASHQKVIKSLSYAA